MVTENNTTESQKNTKTLINFLIWNNKPGYEMQIREIACNSIDNNDCTIAVVSTLDPFFKGHNLKKLHLNIKNKRKLGNYVFQPDAIVRREEHGLLFSGKKWQEFVKKCRETNPKMKSIIYDFGYFDHYKSYVVDIQNSDGRSSIHADWNNLSDTVDWNKSPDYVQEYRDGFLEKLTIAKNCKPVGNLKENDYAVIWPQQYVDLIRPELSLQADKKDKTDQVTNWVVKISKEIKKLGLQPVVKTGPTLNYWDCFDPEKIKDHAKMYVSNANHVSKHCCYLFEKDIDTKLIAHAKFHVICCSSVSNELVLAESPVIATGRSWFHGLNIFNEPTSWDTLLNDPLKLDTKNRNKWVNWWLSRQVKKEDVVNKLVEIYNKYPDFS